MIAQWLKSPMIEVFGWTLVHSLWQLSVVAAGAWLTLWMLRRKAANRRYAVGVMALLLMAAMPVGTGVYLYRTHATASSSADVPVVPAEPVDGHLLTAGPARSLLAPLPNRSTAQGVEGFLPYAVLAYFTGVLALSVRLTLGCLRVRQLRRHALVADPDLQGLLARMSMRLGVKRPIALMESLLVEVPTVIGAMRPMILLPACALTGLSSEQLEGLLAHELAHIRRHDYVLNIVQSAAETMLFYHPGVWWISGCIRREREHCCDDAVLATGTARRTYAEALASMEALRGRTGLAMAANSTRLLPRIRRILGGEARATQSRRLAGVSSALIATGLVAAFVYVVGCSGNAKTPAKETAVEMKEWLIPYSELTEYPEEWMDSPANRAARERLNQNATMAADHEGLAKVIEKLERQNATPVMVNWKSLLEVGIDRDTPVTVTLREIPYRKVLTTILSELPGETGQLGYELQDGVLTISTRDDLNSAKYQVVRVYDIRDLLVQPADGAITPFKLGDLGAAPTSVPAATQGVPVGKQRIVKEIIDTIQSTVAPDSWRDGGGKIGSIHELNGQLVVNQTRDNQAAVYQLLQQLREGRALQISIEARLILVDAATYKKLENSFGKEGAGFSSILTAKQLAEFTKLIQESANSITVTEPRVTMFNGQNGYIASTSQQNYIADCKAGKDGTGKVIPEYDVRTLTCGTVLNLEATVTADRRYTVLKLRPSIRELQKMETFPAPGMPAGKDFIVQKPVLREVEMSTMVSVPDGEAVVLSGVKTRSDLLAGVKGVELGPDPVEDGERYLVVLVRPKIIVQREIEKRP